MKKISFVREPPSLQLSLAVSLDYEADLSGATFDVMAAISAISACPLVSSGRTPANHESAGVRKSVRTNRGNVWLKGTLTQSAWAATNRKGSRLQARYHALRVRCGNKRAIVALGHTLLITVQAVLSTRSPYREAPLAAETERQEERARYHLRCLKKLGYPPWPRSRPTYSHLYHVRSLPYLQAQGAALEWQPTEFS